MAKLYPHKQTVVIFILCVIIVGATAAYMYSQAAQQEAAKGSVSSVTATSTSLQAQIISNTDWQKDFYGNSTSSISKPAAKNTAAAASTKTTVTDKFGREFFSEYTNLKKTGQLSDADAVNSVTEKLLSQDILAAKPDEYTSADIRVSTQSDTAAFKEYGNQVGAIMKKAPAHNDPYIVSQGIQTGTTLYVKELDSNILKYKSMLKSMLEIRVPSEFREAHVEFTNGLSYTLFIASALRETPTDPIKALAGLNVQEAGTTLLFNGFTHIRSALSDEGITYLPQETGSYFNLKP
jgi:hypothetical protein